MTGDQGSRIGEWGVGSGEWGLGNGEWGRGKARGSGLTSKARLGEACFATVAGRMWLDERKLSVLNRVYR